MPDLYRALMAIRRAPGLIVRFQIAARSVHARPGLNGLQASSPGTLAPVEVDLIVPSLVNQDVVYLIGGTDFPGSLAGSCHRHDRVQGAPAAVFLKINFHRCHSPSKPNRRTSASGRT